MLVLTLLLGQFEKIMSSFVSQKIDDASEFFLRHAESFLQQMVANPGDQLVRGIFADWLAENGFWREEAGQRWLIRYGKYPSKSGWYHHSDTPHSHHSLPAVFEKSAENFGVIAAYNPITAEQEFLKRCRELNWDSKGEPNR